MSGLGRRASCLLLALPIALVAHAQVSGHQRVGVERHDAFTSSMDVDLELSPSPEGLPEGSLTLGLGLVFDGGLSIQASLPLILRLDGLAMDSAAWDLLPGRDEISLGFSGRSGDWRLSEDFSLAWSAPEPEGAGEFFCGIRAGAVRFLDPLLLGASLGLETSLPHLERMGSTWRPLSLLLGLTMMEALNGHVSLALSLSQGLAGPRLVRGVWESGLWTWSLGIGLRLFLVSGDWSFRLGVSDPTRPRLEAGFSRVLTRSGP